MQEKFMSLFMELLELEQPIEFHVQLDTLQWDSVARLTFAAMLDEELQMHISTNDFHSAKTIQDLFNSMRPR